MAVLVFELVADCVQGTGTWMWRRMTNEVAVEAMSRKM